MKKFIGFALFFSLLFSVAACGGNAEKTSENNGVEQTTLVDAQLIGGFNGYDEIRTIIFSPYFGRARINKEKNFITEGDSSLKLTVYNYNREESLKIVTGTKYNTLTDYTNVCALTMDFFNDSDEDKNVYINFGTRLSGYTRATYPKKSFVLKPGYNLVIYEIDRAFSRGNTYVDKVEYIGVEFDLNNDEPYDIYLDNLVAHFDDSPVEISRKEYAENEVLFFDDTAWPTFVSTTADMCHPSEVAIISPCRNPRYIKEGKGSMQIKNSKEVVGSGDINSPGVIISGEPIDRIEWGKVQAIEFYICADKDVANGAVNFGLSDSNGTRLTLAYAMSWHNEEWKKDGGFKAGKWYKITIDLVALQNGEVLNGEGKPIVTSLDFKNISKLHFWNAVIKSGKEEWSCYVDEIKLIPKAEAAAN